MTQIIAFNKTLFGALLIIWSIGWLTYVNYKYD